MGYCWSCSYLDARVVTRSGNAIEVTFTVCGDCMLVGSNVGRVTQASCRAFSFSASVWLAWGPSYTTNNTCCCG